MKQIAARVSLALLAASMCATLNTEEAKSKPVSKSDRPKVAATGAAAEGMALLKKKDYKGATRKLDEASRKAPKNESINYYLGIAALYAGDYRTAENALARVVVATDPRSPFHLNALKTFDNYRKELNRTRPYSCLALGKIRHWHPSQTPLKVYVSNGSMLPKELRSQTMNEEMGNQVAKWVKQPDLARRLEVPKHYKPAYRSYALKGLHEWAWATKEDLLKYEVTKDASQANILVFWSDTLDKAVPARTYFPMTKKSPAVIQISVEFLNKYPLNLWPAIMQSVAAHEFGHALGLGESTFNKDLMYPQEKIKFVHSGIQHVEPNQVTNNDATTLRALYQIPADLPK